MDFFPDEDEDENSIDYRINRLENIIREDDDLRDDEDVKYQRLQLKKDRHDREHNDIIEQDINDLEFAIERVLEEKNRTKRRKTAGKKLRRKTKKRKTKKRKTKKRKTKKRKSKRKTKTQRR